MREDTHSLTISLAGTFTPTEDERRTAELRERYLALLLDALRTPDPAPLPGPAPTRQEVGERWQP